MTIRSAHRAPELGSARRATEPGYLDDDSLGIDRIGRGFDLVAYVLILYQLSVFFVQYANYAAPAVSTLAWTVLLISTGAAQIARWRFGENVPLWVFASAAAVWTAVVVLDVAGSWQTPGLLPTAAVATGAGLLLFVTLQPGRVVVIAAAVLGLVLVVTYLLRGEPVLSIGPSIVTLALATMPAALAVGLVRAIRTVAGFERGLAQAQSTVNAPRFAVGLMASEELARLDLAAERLLDSVGSGRIPLPLDEQTASDSASLATELRLHLIEGRRETWLYHAVSESAFLGPLVTVTDPDGMAGLLNPAQRDGLLTSVWLLVSDPVRKGQASAQSLQLTVQRASEGTRADGGSHPIWIRITIVTAGVPRTGVDPAAWQAIRKVGRFVESSTGFAMRIEIECAVENPAD